MSAAWFCLAAVGMYAFHRYQNNMLVTCFLTQASPVVCKIIDVFAEHERMRMGAIKEFEHTIPRTR